MLTPSPCRLVLVLWAALLVAPGVWAQDGAEEQDWARLFLSTEPVEVGVTTFGSDDGIPSLGLSALTLAPDGLLWVASAAGVFTFDGIRFREVGPSRGADAQARTPGAGDHGGGDRQVARRNPEIVRVSSMATDLDGCVWVGGRDGRLLRYPNEQAEPEAVQLELNIVSSLKVTRDGAVWVGGDGAYRLVGETRELIVPKGGRSGLRVLAFAEPPVGAVEDGEVWIASNFGLLRWTRASGVTETDDRPFGGVFLGPNGNRWAALLDGRILQEGSPDVQLKHPIGRMRGSPVVLEHITLVTFHYGILSISNSTGEFKFNYVGPLGSTKAALAAPDDGLWVGQESEGLRHIAVRAYRSVEVPMRGILAARVLPLGKDDVLLAAHSQGTPFVLRTGVGLGSSLIAEPMENGRPGLLGRGVQDTAQSTHGERYLTGSTGVVIQRDDVLAPVPGGDRASWGCVASPHGSVWVDMGDSLDELLLGEWTDRSWPLPLTARSKLEWARDGIVGIEGPRVFHLDPGTGVRRNLLEFHGANGRDLHVDPDSTIWVTTYGQGLFRIGPNGTVDQWGSESGLLDRFLSWVGAVPGPTFETHLWCNANSGAFAVSRASLNAYVAGEVEHVRCTGVNTPEANGHTGCPMDSGHLILPTLKGPVVIDTNRALEDLEPPQLSLKFVLADGVKVEPGNFPSGFTDLEFCYDSVLFPDGHDAHVEVRLDGHDDHWALASGDGLARYAHLGPGEYTFRLRARAPGGAFGGELRAPTVVIRPRWYQGLLVRFAGLAGLLVLGFVLARVRTRQVLRRSSALEAEVHRRMNAESVLQAERAQFEQVLETAHEGIFFFNEDGTILYGNPAAQRTFGLLPSDMLVGRSVLDLGIGDLSNQEQLRALFRSGGDVRWDGVETTARRMDGAHIDLDASLAPDSASGQLHYVAIVRDVSDRSVMLDELRRSQERFRRLFQTAPAPMMAWDERQTIIEWNDHADRFFYGAKGAAVSAKSYRFAANETALRQIEGGIAKILGGAPEVSFTMETRVQGDQVRLCSWLLAPLVKVDGDVRAFISIVLDKSEEVRAQQDLQRLRRQLSKAEESERARIARELHDDFSQRIAALAINVNVAASRLLSADAPGPPPKSIEDLREAHQELRSLATDVHSLSRRLHPTVLEDLGLAAALRSECSRRAALAGAEIELQYEEPMEDLQWEIGLAIFRVVQEALQNALSHGGARSITVSLERQPGALVLSVDDDGKGFDPDATAGPGIGLASMGERVQLVGGSLTVDSTPGRGTKLVATIPRG